nr:putative ribonuclease H-like domain-containing protein [Tanacetum cinerariifolium]
MSAMDSDYGGATQDRKSTTEGCQFFGRRLISWQCKKQKIVATSTTKAEYVAAASCCGQVLWIQNQLLDYGLSMPYEAFGCSNSVLEDKDRGVAEQSGDDAPIKGMRLDEGDEAAKRVSDDTKEMTTVLTSMDAASILTSGGVQVVLTAIEVATATVSIPTSSGVVSTTSPTIPTAAPIFTTATESTPYTRRKGKQTMVESETPKKKKVHEQINVQVARELEEEMIKDSQRMNEQIARDVEIARLHAEEELQMLIDGLDRNNETVAKYLQEYDQFGAELSFERRIELISDLIEDFIPMGSKEETERFKRKGLRLEQESAKKLKTSEEIPEEVKSPEKVPKEKVKEMMQLVPVEEIYVEALQVKHPIIDWKVHIEGQRSY